MLSRATFDKKEFELEKKVVIQEIIDENNDPEMILSQDFFNLMYPNHPYGRSIAGTTKTVRNITIEKMKSFYEKHYVGGNIVISVAGNIEHEQILSIVENLFSKIPAGKTSALSFPEYKGGFRQVCKDSSRIMVGIGFDIPYSKDLALSSLLLSQVFGCGDCSRLNKSVREKNGLAYEIYSSFNNEKNYLSLHVFVQCSAKNVNKIIKLIIDEINLLKTTLIPEEELNIHKKLTEVAYIKSLEISEFLCGSNAKLLLEGKRIKQIDEIIRKLYEVTTEDLLSIAQQTFTGNFSYIVHGGISGFYNINEIRKMLK